MFWNRNKISELKLEDIDDEKDLFRSDLEEYLDEEEVSDVSYVHDEKKDENIIEVSYHETNNSIRVINKFVNIFLVFVVVIGGAVFLDTLCVSKFNVGPFFAVKTKTYNDGGTKEYKGLFYKVIKYAEREGRVDTVIGSWKLDYSVKSKDTDILDLALNFNNDLNYSMDTYMDQYLKISGEISDLSEEMVILKYNDEDHKYSTTIRCNLLDSSVEYKKGDQVEVVGTLYNYSNKNATTLFMKNCYIK